LYINNKYSQKRKKYRYKFQSIFIKLEENKRKQEKKIFAQKFIQNFNRLSADLITIILEEDFTKIYTQTKEKKEGNSINNRASNRSSIALFIKYVRWNGPFEALINKDVLNKLI
jgi:hypothetical protein